ncbi:hypothetical protein LCGC14_1561450 [marine sediment metagenome]|uniref:MYND-type domain-containing protein n=1 Tax=marine sediment metagenome TaxID=412755 RepID=A0A0F9LN26_9ZZZZ
MYPLKNKTKDLDQASCITKKQHRRQRRISYSSSSSKPQQEQQSERLLVRVQQKQQLEQLLLQQSERLHQFYPQQFGGIEYRLEISEYLNWDFIIYDQNLRQEMAKGITAKQLEIELSARFSDTNFKDRYTYIYNLICDKCHKLYMSYQLKRCSRCKVIYYCSKECQKKDWKKIHKFICEPINS